MKWYQFSIKIKSSAATGRQTVQKYEKVPLRCFFSLEKLDDSRVERMSRKSTDVAKKRRKTIRAKQKGFSDSLTEKEPIDSYSTGGY